MQIHVARNSAQLGVFTSEEIVAGLQSGRFLASDLAWREGLPNWTPLGDWSEFRAVGVPASPRAADAPLAGASTIPWEQGKSPGSFFATLSMAVANPSALATGRFSFGDWLVYCYFAELLVLPFQLIGALGYGDKNAQLAELLGSWKIPGVDQFAEQLAHAPQTPVWATAIGAVFGVAIGPLMYAFFALAHWVGQRIFRYQVPVERTVAATLLATSVLLVLMAPLQLLGFSFLTQMIFGAIVLIPACIVYYRALGAGTGISAWVQFGISCFVWFILFCCCCLLPLMLVAGVGSGLAR